MQALQHRNTARQQHLRLDALRHARERHQDRANAVLGSISGATRSTDLARTILKAQLQSLHQALQTLKVSLMLSLPANAAKLPVFWSGPSSSSTVPNGQLLHHTAILLRLLLTLLLFLDLEVHHEGDPDSLPTELFWTSQDHFWTSQNQVCST